MEKPDVAAAQALTDKITEVAVAIRKDFPEIAELLLIAARQIENGTDLIYHQYRYIQEFEKHG